MGSDSNCWLLAWARAYIALTGKLSRPSAVKELKRPMRNRFAVLLHKVTCLGQKHDFVGAANLALQSPHHWLAQHRVLLADGH